jgi:DNA-binding phage protein
MSTPNTRRSVDRSLHDRLLSQQLQDPEFRKVFEREKAELEAIDRIINSLESLRDAHHVSKARLARSIGKQESAVRRLLTAPGNPTLRTVVAVADALDADVAIVSRGSARVNERPGRKRVPKTVYLATSRDALAALKASSASVASLARCRGGSRTIGKKTAVRPLSSFFWIAPVHPGQSCLPFSKSYATRRLPRLAAAGSGRPCTTQ